MNQKGILSFLICLLIIASMSKKLKAQESLNYQQPPKEIADILLAPPTPYLTFDNAGKWMLMLDRVNYPPISELAQPELRLAGIRINPANNGQSRSNGFTGMKLVSLKDKKEYLIKELPANSKIENVSFSPDGKYLSFTLSFTDHIELWIAPLTDFKAKRLSSIIINAAIPGYPYEWSPDSRTIIVLVIPKDRGKAPESTSISTGPIVQQTNGSKAPVRTFQDMLRNENDAKLFEYYCTSQLVSVSLSGKSQVLMEKGIFIDFSMSPDGKYILMHRLHRPFSLQVSYNRFPMEISILDTLGKPIRMIADIPVAEDIPKGFSSVRKGPRDFVWRSDVPAELYWVEAQDGGDAEKKADIRDRLYHMAAPFDKQPIEGLSFALRFDNIYWYDGKLAVVNESWWETRKTVTSFFAPDNPKSDKKVIFDRSSEDTYDDPGAFEQELNEHGKPVLLSPDKGESLFLEGQGASPEGNRPFLRKFDVKTKKIIELWRSTAPWFETSYKILDPIKLTVITSRESVTEPANFYIRTVKTGKLEALTSFPNPYPQLSGVKKQSLKYHRKDGILLTGNLYLPYADDSKNKNLPVLVWAYPQEFKSATAASQVKDSPYRFMHISWASPLFWLARGYAVLDDPSLPIVGEGKQEPNDTYIEQLVAGAKAAVDTLVSMGVADPKKFAIGGHSYGAFMAANLMAHSELFAAGIARSGAYNRTLTPFGFQAEERTLWEAKDVYARMSPFMYADKIKNPILLIHGEADNNSGTFPIQSERFYAALKGHGATARLVILPYESHSYRAKESLLHMLWEMDQWLDKYVRK
jgi:dipeptidyl aminopeptidase/acylaminoacyl peptidase